MQIMYNAYACSNFCGTILELSLCGHAVALCANESHFFPVLSSIKQLRVAF